MRADYLERSRVRAARRGAVDIAGGRRTVRCLDCGALMIDLEARAHTLTAGHVLVIARTAPPARRWATARRAAPTGQLRLEL